jgi:starch phosphorylase
MTYVALRFAGFVNGVTMRHRDVSREMFPRHRIDAITNGVHAATWTVPAFQQLYDRHLPAWRRDNNYLRYAIGISVNEIMQAHQSAKRELLGQLRTRTGSALDESVMTIGFARRASTYKRADLLFHNIERLAWIARNAGPFQLVYGGKAHPQDEGGKQLIRRIYQAADALSGIVRVVFVEDYDMAWAKLLTSGVDLWLNTPQRPQEASGTSGMKAALNGVPSFSITDGWWIEGHLENVTGWSIGNGDASQDLTAEVSSLYDKLGRVILPLFYAKPQSYAEVMRSATALNGAFFNTNRMLLQYLGNAYLPTAQREAI